jgi:thioredoxin 1
MSDKIKVLTSENFESEVLKANVPVLVDFWADWCGPCKMISPSVDQAAQAFEGKAIVGKVNVDDCNDIARTYGVMSIPTLILYKDGMVVDQVVGMTTANAIVKLMDKHI